MQLKHAGSRHLQWRILYNLKHSHRDKTHARQNVTNNFQHVLNSSLDRNLLISKISGNSPIPFWVTVIINRKMIKQTNGNEDIISINPWYGSKDVRDTSAERILSSSSSSVSGDCVLSRSASRQHLSWSILSEMSRIDCRYCCCRRNVSLNSSCCLSNCTRHCAIHFAHAEAW